MSNEIRRRALRLVDNGPSPVSPGELARPEVDVGQIWIARPDEGPDVLVLIIEVQADHVQALLCSEDDGLGTETDAVLEPRLIGHPRPLLVHGDLAGAILRARLVGSPGRIDRGLVRRIVCVAAGWTSIRTISGGGGRWSASPIHAGSRRWRGSTSSGQ